ncbi:hypothetical protein PROFUN_17166, partial [Planoprotostelium fungivorum]
SLSELVSDLKNPQIGISHIRHKDNFTVLAKKTIHFDRSNIINIDSAQAPIWLPRSDDSILVVSFRINMAHPQDNHRVIHHSGTYQFHLRILNCKRHNTAVTGLHEPALFF